MEVNNLNTEHLLKFLGIIFFIGMVWFFVFTVFKTNNHFLGILLKEKEEETDYRREGFEGYQNLKTEGTEVKRKINKKKEEKENNEKKAGISKDASDDLKDDVSEYIRYEIENLDSLAVIELLDLEKKHDKESQKFFAINKILKKRDNMKQLEKIFNSK